MLSLSAVLLQQKEMLMSLLSRELNTDPSLFQEHGYVLLKNFLPAEDLIEANKWISTQDPHSLTRSWMDTEPEVPCAVYQNIHKAQTPVAKCASNPKVLETASKLMNDEAYIWSSKVNMKAAWAGTAEYYHQDFVYWKDRGYSESKMLTCMMPLEHQDVENAALHVFPGSHKEGFIEHTPFCNINSLSKFMVHPKKLDELYKKYGLAAITAEPGDALFFHTNIVHGSAHNISPRSRRIILSQMNTRGNVPEDTKVNAKQFNLNRAEFEINKLKERLAQLEEKYNKEKNSEELVFNSPIQEEDLTYE